MKFSIITIFPKIFNSYLNESIIKRAQKNGLIKIKIYNLRDFTKDKHRKVDGKPFGGGPGMVLKIEPIIKIVSSIKCQVSRKKTKIILFTPSGKQFNNKIAIQLARNYKHLILIAGRYEGIDARAAKIIKNLKLKIENLSIGNYVLTGGELPSMVLIDVVSRQIKGVLGKNESLEEKRFGIGLPVYTRPEILVYKGKKYQVPKVLLSGNHKKINDWQRKNTN